MICIADPEVTTHRTIVSVGESFIDAVIHEELALDIVLEGGEVDLVLGDVRSSNVGDNLVEARGCEAPLENSMLAGLDDVGEGKETYNPCYLSRYGSSTQFAASRDDPELQRSRTHL